MLRPQTSIAAPCGLRVVRIDSLHFVASCRKRQLNQALPIFVLVQFFIVLLLIRALFYIVLCVSLCLSWYVFCLLVVLVKLSLLAK